MVRNNYVCDRPVQSAGIEMGFQPICNLCVNCEKLDNITTVHKGVLPSATNCEGNVFTPVCHSVHRGGGFCLSACWDTTPWGQTPPKADTPLRDQAPPRSGTHPGADPPGIRHPSPNRRLLLWMVRILLECILVINCL